MKRISIFLLSFLTYSPFFAFSQQTSLRSQIETLIRKRSPEAKVYINSASDFLEVDLSPENPDADCQIPYMQVTFTYKYNDDGNPDNKFKYMVCIDCIDGEHTNNCIKCGDQNSSGLCSGFPTKENAYNFIELMSKLKKQSSNR